MIYRLFTPTLELSDIVSCYWYAPIMQTSYSKQQFSTPLFECMVFNFTNLKETHQSEGGTHYLNKTAYMFGQTSSCNTISGIHEKEGYIIGIAFKPLGLAKITGINMVYLANKVVDVEDIWGNELKYLCEAMQEANSLETKIMVLESFLKKQLRAIKLHYRVKNVADAISLMKKNNGQITCKELQYLTNTTRKTFERAFMNFHGLKPKVYNQIIRFNAAKQQLGRISSTNLTKLNCQLGYFDQSHFIKNFKRFSGQTPTEYLKALEEEHKKRTMPIH